MILLRDVMGMLAFRSAAIRRLAFRKSILTGWLIMSSGFLLFSVARALLYPIQPLFSSGSHGWLDTFLHLHVIQLLVFLAVIYAPAVICLANALAGDGLGFSFSREEYRVHVSVLFPLWGSLFLGAALIEWLVPRLLHLGFWEISVAEIGLL